MTQELNTENLLNEEGSIVEKAYQIDFQKIEDGYEYTTKICYAKSLNEAKSLLLQLVKYFDLKHRFTGEPITYLNIPVLRCKSLDKLLFEGQVLVKSDIDYILQKRTRASKLEEILQNPDIKYCYIIKGSFYRPNYCGYTSKIIEAGVYEKKDAIEHVRNVMEATVEPVNVEVHNHLVMEEIKKLQELLIKVD